MRMCTCGDLLNISCPVHGHRAVMTELTLAEPTKQTILFAGGGETILTIHPDGRLERGPGFANDDAASLAFLDCLSRHCPGFIGDLRKRAETARDDALEDAARVLEREATYNDAVARDKNDFLSIRLKAEQTAEIKRYCAAVVRGMKGKQ